MCFEKLEFVLKNIENRFEKWYNSAKTGGML